MSDESLRLSDELITGVVNVLVQHDPRAEQDMMLGLQYLAAISGYIAASYPGADSERDELLEHLAAFTRHVTTDRASKLQQQQQEAETPAGRSVETDNPAVGIWKPE